MCDILKSIGKRKIANVLIFFQIVFSFIYFFTTAVSIQRVFYVYQEVPKLLYTDSHDILMAEIQNDGVEGKEFQKFCDEVKKDGAVERISTYHNTWVDSKRLKNDPIDGVEMSGETDWIKKLEISQGQNLTEEDFDSKKVDGSKDHPLPILVGQKLMEKYSLQIGEKFDDINGICYIVKGVLCLQSQWFLQTIPEGLCLSLDNQVVVPLLEDNNVQMYYYFKLKMGQQAEVVCKELKKTAEQYNIILSVNTVAQFLQDGFERNLQENKQWLIFSLSTLGMISIGLATLITARMYMRKKEIGVRIAVGYTIHQILSLFIGEMVVLVVAGMTTALVISQVLFGNGMESWEGMQYITGSWLTREIIVGGMILGGLMCIPSVIVLFIKFSNIQPKGLIGGKE